MYPAKSFYCDLCSKFMVCAEEARLHLKCDRHVQLYKVSYNNDRLCFLFSLN